MLWLDLCSGLGGASRPALDRGWRVIRVDIDPRFKPDIVADVRSLPLKPFDIDVLWASPVCTAFTKWGLPDSWQRTPKVKPSTELADACLAAVHYLRPRWWIIENVMASRPFLSPLLGPVRVIMPGHVLWGRLPCLLPPTRAHKWKLSPSPERAALRAQIPYEIGEAICIAVERRLGVYDAVASV